ncbi:hypothetical protein BG011_007169 [Mortierella polycephala]|uniref:VTT domain-containing protein n=1 Tax=Mortierella polycephala TaxID=41804 RepID=A0A9P6U8Y0_9FUNG|nr:hypothetical protein BG011_007169 [Mortierella polycephala]
MAKKKAPKNRSKAKATPGQPSASTPGPSASTQCHDTPTAAASIVQTANIGALDEQTADNVDSKIQHSPNKASQSPLQQTPSVNPSVTEEDSRRDSPTQERLSSSHEPNNEDGKLSDEPAKTQDIAHDHYKPSPPRRYEDDDDNNGHLQTEHSPLIRTGSQDSVGYSSGSEGTGTPVYPVRDQRRHPQPTPQPMTWLEWTLQNGLHPRTWNRQTYIKAGLLVTMLTLIVLSLTVFRIQDHIKDVLRYIDHHKRVGAVLFVLSYTVACTLFLPGSLFTVGAGFLFKPFPLALLIVLAGDVFAAVTSFIFGRYVFYDWVKSIMSKHPKFNALEEVIKDDGWKIVVMLRLTPIPFNLITYFFSITSIRLWTVVWATCVGVFPGSCIGIWIGSLLKGLSGIDKPELANKNVVILAMNGVFVVCCILTLSMFGKRSLRKAMKRLDQHQALTSMHEVEIVVEGVATVIRELEDSASIPPSLRSTMIEQLAAEEEDEDYYYRRDLEAADQRLLGPNSHSAPKRNRSEDDNAEDEDAGGASSTSGTSAAVNQNSSSLYKVNQLHHPHRLAGASAAASNLPSSGFTRGEKMIFVAIAVVAVLNVCVCVPLYFHFANEED